MNRIYVNNNWQFIYNFDENLHNPDFYSSKVESVRIPHTTKELPFNYFSEEEYQTLSGYRRRNALTYSFKSSVLQSAEFGGVKGAKG